MASTELKVGQGGWSVEVQGEWGVVWRGRLGLVCWFYGLFLFCKNLEKFRWVLCKGAGDIDYIFIL